MCPVCTKAESAPHPPGFFVSVHSKGLNASRKSCRMNTCGDFLEVLIIKGLLGKKTRQNTMFHERLILKDLAERRAGRPKMKKAAEGLPRKVRKTVQHSL